MTVESSYGDYCKGLNSFWKEDELYGSITEPNKIVP